MTEKFEPVEKKSESLQLLEVVEMMKKIDNMYALLETKPGEKIELNFAEEAEEIKRALIKIQEKIESAAEAK